ncbi:hypothetical protein EKH77_03915 [Streptomyces luteoverticillatus]|uniref:Uncharacterized protein n=1 Tax=Streptomyces luteoverticillatus TaxID=66425 RepID=A0A3Q9FT17_STRLT|nr:hypothetical protein EKH77_03915 [Streptomyces luteoverticillatus]
MWDGSAPGLPAPGHPAPGHPVPAPSPGSWALSPQPWLGPQPQPLSPQVGAQPPDPRSATARAQR